MDNAQKAIMIGVGLFLTILIITIVLLVTNLGVLTTKSAADSVGTISETLKQQLITQYDNKVVTGQDVSFAISQYDVQLKHNIYVKTGSTFNCITGAPGTIAESGTSYLQTVITPAPTGKSVAALTAEVNLSVLYNSYLVKDSSAEVIGLAFVPK